MHTKKDFIIKATSLLVLICLAAVVFFPRTNERKEPYKWYETVMMYHVFVKGFADGNEDGKGDLKGLIQKLDYIQKLGVNTLYMLPITPALNNPDMPRSHYGYEITDFKSIHPDYGTIEDFKTLVKEAHKRGIRIVLDFITTVISVQHPFFQDILNNPNSRYKDWIIHSDTPPEGEWMNFNDYAEQFQAKAWNPLPHGGFYYSLWGSSPFLNYHNPEVQEYILSVIDFWLDLGADGFRIDATKHLFINGPGEALQYHQPENFEFWKKLRLHIRNKYGDDKALIAEVIPIPNEIRYIEPNRETFDSMFDPLFINEIYPYTATDINLLFSSTYLHSFFDDEVFFKTTKLQDRLAYHSDHDGARVATRIENGTPDQLKLAASILLFTPAHIKLYAGDEIGIKGFSDFNDFKNKWFHATLASMAWDDSKNGGFSKSDAPIIPITDDYVEINVKKQENDPESLLNHYRAAIALKRAYPHYFFKGERFSYPVQDEKIYAYFLNNADKTALVIMNLSPEARTFEADFSKNNAGKAKLIFGSKNKGRFNQDKGKISLSDIPPYAAYVVEFDSFDFNSLKEVQPELLKKRELLPSGEVLRTKKEEILLLNIPLNIAALKSGKIPKAAGVLRLKKGQGKIKVSGYAYDKINFISIFKGDVDTGDEDILLPVFNEKMNAVVLPEGIDFSFEPAHPEMIFDGKIHLISQSKDNQNLRAFYAGMDKNFLYLKIDRTAYVLPQNGGLDFALLINNGFKSSGTHNLSFWRLLFITSGSPIDSVILYERHIRTARIQTGINKMRFMGINSSNTSFTYETDKAIFIIVSRKLFPLGQYNIAPIVWSAGGNWGDKPPQGKQIPIVERLPFDAKKQYLPNHVGEYLPVE